MVKQVEKICIGCGKVFKNNYAIYCSLECNNKSTGRGPSVYKKTCKICKKEFKTNRYNRKYCSDKCRKIFHKKRTTEYYDRNKKQKKKAKKIIPKINYIDRFQKVYEYDQINYNGNRVWCLIRDKFTCQNCGKKHDLTIHHKDGKGFALPPEKRNNNINNLIILCEKCHIKEERDDIKVENYIPRFNKTCFI